MEKGLLAQCFSVNFANILGTRAEHRTKNFRKNVFCVFLATLRSFSEQLFYRIPPGDCLLHVQIAGHISTYTIKIYFTGAFYALCTKAISGHSMVFN